jgi:hypothetical protein
MALENVRGCDHYQYLSKNKSQKKEKGNNNNNNKTKKFFSLRFTSLRVNT